MCSCIPVCVCFHCMHLRWLTLGTSPTARCLHTVRRWLPKSSSRTLPYPSSAVVEMVEVVVLLIVQSRLLTCNCERGEQGVGAAAP